MTTMYKWLAGVIAVLAVVGIIYGKGRLDQKHALELSSVRTELATAQIVIAKEKEARLLDNEAAKAANLRLNELNSSISGLHAYVDALEDANSQCLSGADTDRLRTLWK